MHDLEPVNLEETVALVTGGAKRVGRCIVLELARAGCNMAIHYRHSEAEAELLKREVTALGRRAVTVQADLTEPHACPAVIRETVSALGRLDILVNNAAVFLTDQPDTLDGFYEGQWQRLLGVNLIAPMALCHHARRHLAERGSGRIVNLCDISAHRPWPDHLGYCASKAALECLTKGLARAMAPAVRVNGVAPGIAVFPHAYPEDVRRRLVSRVPLEREGTPEEVARVVRFLVEQADYITGQVIPIDGGRSLV